MSFLTVESIRKNFGSTEVLKGIDFSLERGNVLSIIGSSGSGKTTLLRCLNFLETPDTGRISIGNSCIFDAADNTRKSAASIRENRLHFGLVFQSFNLFPQYTVMENLMLAPVLRAKEEYRHAKTKPDLRECLAEIEQNARELLRSVGLSEKRDAYPCRLSGGQQQRVSIARALALHPDILCFDEPTSALDPELTGEVLKVIRALRDEGRTMIVVTHEMEFARQVSDEIIFMADGIIEEKGSPEEIFGNPQSPLLKHFLSVEY